MSCKVQIGFSTGDVFKNKTACLLRRLHFRAAERALGLARLPGCCSILEQCPFFEQPTERCLSGTLPVENEKNPFIIRAAPAPISVRKTTRLCGTPVAHALRQGWQRSSGGPGFFGSLKRLYDSCVRRSLLNGRNRPD
jgi:hypothetical protein